MSISRIDDRWLWLGFGVFLFIAAKGIRYAITDTVRLTDIGPTKHKPSKKKEEELADRISLKDLQLLAESENAAISNAAISIFMQRFARQKGAYRSVKSDAEQNKDEELRTRAKHALGFLRAWRYDINLRLDDIDISDGSVSPFEISSNSSDGLEDLARRLADVTEISGDGWVDPAASSPATIVPSLDNPVAGWTNVPRERPDMDEAERRRRRREAMVFREGEGGVEESDIFRPLSHQ